MGMGPPSRRRARVAILAVAVSAAVLACSGCGNRASTALSVKLSAVRARPAPVARGDDPRSGTHLVFADDFTGDRLDPARWRTCYPWTPPDGCTNQTNGEAEWYVPQQVQVAGGALHIIADRRAVVGVTPDGRPEPFEYVSGLVSSAGRFAFTYGYVEFDAVLPEGAGLWPALWLAPASGAWPPEIDVMEARDGEPGTVHLFLHPAQGDQAGHTVTGLAAGAHTFAVDWEPGQVRWYVDGVMRFSTTVGVPSAPMYLIMNLAVGGWGGTPGRATPLPADLVIHRVAVWQH